MAERLHMAFYSVGGLRGKMAHDRGITIDELNRLGENDPTTDTSVDDYQKYLGEHEDQFVIEGRLSWHFIPHSFKVLLTCDVKEAARRIYEAKKALHEERFDEPEYANPEEVEQAIISRTHSDISRYQKYYKIDYRNPSHFDAVIDTTTNKNAEETMQQILNAVKERSSSIK